MTTYYHKLAEKFVERWRKIKKILKFLNFFYFFRAFLLFNYIFVIFCNLFGRGFGAVWAEVVGIAEGV